MFSEGARVVAGVILVGFCGVMARGQTSPAPAKVTLDLTDPQSALAGYFQAQKANDQASLLKAIAVTDPAKKTYVEYAVLYELWARYLERQAIVKFGKEAGIGVEGHVRSLDDQSDLDLKRVKEANVQFNTEKTAATVFLRVEPGRPEILGTDDFTFLDVYKMVKTAAGWQVDFLRTCHRFDADPDTAANCKGELSAFPRMARNLKTLVDQLKGGQINTADELKAMLDNLWTRVYEQPTDTSGRTEAEAQAQTQPAAQKDGP